MCHVCHSWRTIAHSTPELWTRLQLHLNVKPPALEQLWTNSKSLPVSFRLNGFQRIAAPHYLHNFKHILPSSLAKLKDLSLILQGSRYVTDLLQSLTGRAENLRSLELVGKWGNTTEISLNFLAGGAPNLRRVHLEYCILPWTSAVFHSPHLTHLSVHDTALPTLDSLAEVVAVLNGLPQLEVFAINIPEPANPIRSTVHHNASRQVEVPRMMRFKISSVHLEPLTEILSAIRLPDTIQDLVLRFRQDGSSNPPLQDLYDACSPSFATGFAPTEVCLSSGTTSDWDCRHHLSATQWVTPRNGNLSGEGVAQCIQISSDNPRVHPFCSPAPTRLFWSFNNLRSLKVTDLKLPDAVWETLALAPVLETIEVPGNWSFFKALRGKSAESNTSSTSTPKTNMNTQVQSPMLRFPALQHLAFLSVERQFGTVWFFVQQVVDSFKERGGKKLVELEFRAIWSFSNAEVERLDIETPLSTIAERVKWGDKELDLPKDVVVTRSKAKGTVEVRRGKGSGKRK